MLVLNSPLTENVRSEGMLVGSIFSRRDRRSFKFSPSTLVFLKTVISNRLCAALQPAVCRLLVNSSFFKQRVFD